MDRKIQTPLAMEIPWCEPAIIFEQLHHKKWAIFLDSAQVHAHYGRFSYIALEPFKTLWVKDHQICVDGSPITSGKNPFHVLNELLKGMSQVNLTDLPPFQGGIAGSFSYDLYQYLENIPPHCGEETDFPDMALGFYDVVISFDAHQKRAWIISTGWPESEPVARLSHADKRLNYFNGLIQDAITAEKFNCHFKTDGPTLQNISSNFTRQTYTKAVQRAIDYILAGDIFEVNLSQCFKAQLPENLAPFDLYKQLRYLNPAPFAAFFNLGDTMVLSASPERFLQVLDGKVETRPIKGTRPRSTDLKRDKQLADELRDSIKDHAENVMIVDLMRNDLSKVCKDHSIEVTQLCQLESFATVHHLVSVITGELKSDQNALDLLLAAFPGGSVTGAPKIRAMQIIAEIEPVKRGLYCGSLGYAGFNGAMDTSIVIRTCIIKDNIITFQTGGAIVADSNPEDEYQETLCKASVLSDLLEGLHDFTD